MKYNVSILALMVGGAMPGVAFAACQNGQYEYYTATGSGTDSSPYVAVQHCVQTDASNVSGHYYGIPRVDPSDVSATKQLIVGGHPIVDSAPLSSPTSHVYGQSGLAEGDGAQVGRSVPQVGTGPTCTNGGTLAGNTCTIGTSAPWFAHSGDNKPAGCTNGGTLSGTSCTPAASTIVPASPDYAPAHVVNVNNGTAIGANTSVQADHSTAIGAGAVADKPNTVVLGTSSDTVVMPGNADVKGALHVTGTSVFDNAVTINTVGHTTSINGNGATFTSATGGTRIDGGNVTNTGTTTSGSLNVQHDANVGGGLYVTGPASIGGGATVSGGLVTDTLSVGGVNVGATLDNYGSRLSTLEGWESVAKNQISDLQNKTQKASEGVAIALAAQNFTLETGKKFGVSANVGTFEGNTALASSVAFRLDQNWQINGSVGFGTNNGTVGARAGVVGQW
jgi:trimeric autotransporter adhesin